jgi:hypothetical protein
MMNSTKRRRLAMKLAMSGLALYGVAGGVAAADIDLGNPDISMQWGNTLRYNIGARAEGRNPGWETSGISSTQAKYDKGDIVINRVDWLSELDFSYKGIVGFRLSGSAWYNAEFDRQVGLAPGRPSGYNYNNNLFSNYTKRYHGGPSAEVLDAYVFTNFDMGDMRTNVKVGRQVNLWGEAMVLSAHSISNQQQPVDGLKAASSPGIDAKEVQLPVGQIHATTQVNDKLSVSAMYQYEWLPTRLAEGGTYLASSDMLLRGPDRLGARINGGLAEPNNNHDWGVNARYNSDLLDGVVGVYFRNYTEKAPTLSLSPTTYRAVYAKNTKLYGLSLAKLIAGMSIGAEASYRQDAALKSTILDGAAEGARGNTYHALVNVAKQWGQTDFWSQINLTGELAYSHLDKVTSGGAYFRPCAPGADVKRTGCSSKNNWEATVRVTPTWTAVAPGWDLSATTSLTYGLKGNGSTTGAASEGGGSWTVGATATYNNQHDFSIAYNDATSPVGPQPDRGWVSLTYKYQF